MTDDSKMPELKPCPFCGQDGLLQIGKAISYVKCCHCEAEGPAYSKEYHDLAAKNWNTRAPSDAARGEVLDLFENGRWCERENIFIYEFYPEELETIRAALSSDREAELLAVIRGACSVITEAISWDSEDSEGVPAVWLEAAEEFLKEHAAIISAAQERGK